MQKICLAILKVNLGIASPICLVLNENLKNKKYYQQKISKELSISKGIFSEKLNSPIGQFFCYIQVILYGIDLMVNLMTTKPPLVIHVIGQMYFMMQILYCFYYSERNLKIPLFIHFNSEKYHHLIFIKTVNFLKEKTQP